MAALQSASCAGSSLGVATCRPAMAKSRDYRALYYRAGRIASDRHVVKRDQIAVQDCAEDSLKLHIELSRALLGRSCQSSSTPV